MATLSADIPAIFDPRWEIGLIQRPCTTTDVYFRGGLAHELDAGTAITLTPVDADSYAGVVMEHKSATTADLIWIGSAGRWFFTCANFSAANYNVAFAIQSGDLTDNPSTLDVVGAGDAGACGILMAGGATAGTDGWINTDVRIAASNS